MKSKRLFAAIGNIDDKFIDEDADINVLKGSSYACKAWDVYRYAGLAACAAVLLFCVWMIPGLFNTPIEITPGSPNGNVVDTQQTDPTPAQEEVPGGIPDRIPNPDNDAVPQVAYGFLMDGRLYTPISFEDRKKYCLIPQEDFGATPDNYYVITEDDLGEIMGAVESSADESLIGATIYHFVSFPNSFAICIVDRTPISTDEPTAQTGGDMGSG